MFLKVIVCFFFLYQALNAATPDFTEAEKQSFHRQISQNLRSETIQLEEQEGVVALPQVGAQQEYSLSGFSAGGFMVVQHAVAHSSQVTGVGVVAGGPYYCAQGSYNISLSACLDLQNGPTFNMTRSVQETNNLSQTGEIDQTENLNGEVVWLFAGDKDDIVSSSMAVNTENYYKHYGATNIARINNADAGHGFIMADYSGAAACSNNAWEYLNNCSYNAAKAILTSIYGTLNPPGSAVTSSLIAFDQTPYYALGLGKTGYVYIPEACRSKSCNIHMFLHGCRQYVGFKNPYNNMVFGTELVQYSGFNQYAETNDLIILYPQGVNVTLNKANSAGFSGGCFDYWGYTGSDYVTKQAAQITSFNEMIQQLQSSQASAAFRAESSWLPYLMLFVVIFSNLH